MRIEGQGQLAGRSEEMRGKQQSGQQGKRERARERERRDKHRRSLSAPSVLVRFLHRSLLSSPKDQKCSLSIAVCVCVFQLMMKDLICSLNLLIAGIMGPQSRHNGPVIHRSVINSIISEEGGVLCFPAVNGLVRDTTGSLSPQSLTTNPYNLFED